jgi:2-dehydropantoate 2-reductase
VTPTANIMGFLWTKLGYVAMLAATALVDEDQVPVMRRFPELLIDLATEIYEVALAEGVRLEAEGGVEPHLYVPRAGRDEKALRRSFSGLVEYASVHHKPRSGIWRDLAVRRRQTEVGEHLGTARRIGEGHGLSLPLTQRLLQLIHGVEAGERGMSWGSLEELDLARAAQIT